MIKFSLYEFLSYIVPGYLLLWIMKKEIIPSSVFTYLTEGSSDAFNFTTFLGFAIITGVIFHFVTDKIQGIKYFKNIFREHPSDIIKNSSEHFKGTYEKVKTQMENNKLSHTPMECGYLEYSFDDAYHYLDVNNKNDSVIKFQSIYYLLRNTSIVCLFSIIALLVVFLCRSIFYSSAETNILNWTFLMVLGIFCWATGLISKTLREKYIKRTFYLYYIDNIHKQKQTS